MRFHEFSQGNLRFSIEVTLFCLTQLLVWLRRCWIIIYILCNIQAEQDLEWLFTPRATVNLVLLYCHRADFPVSTYRPTILSIYYCEFSQRLHDAYRDITWQLVKNIAFHVLPNSSYHMALFPVRYWHQYYIKINEPNEGSNIRQWLL